MNRLKPTLQWLGAALVASMFVAACDNPSAPEDLPPGPSMAPSAADWDGARVTQRGNTLRVYTRNIYLGGDTGPLFSLDFTDTSPGNVVAIITAVNQFWAQVQLTDFASRAEAIADEIQRSDPHVVALQEVAKYAAIDFSSGSPQVVGGLDMIATLQAILAGRGLSYDLLLLQDNTTGQLPLGINPSSGQFTSVLSFQLSEATLVRSDVQVTDADRANYQADLNLGPLTLKRGWSRVAFTLQGKDYTVVNTHLETQGLLPLHNLQADELIGSVIPSSTGNVVVVGDLNSDAEGEPGDPSWTPTFGRLMDAGFLDAWAEAPNTEDVGFTCCHDPLLMNNTSDLDERIDFILVRPEAPRPRAGMVSPMQGVTWAEVFGDEVADQTATDLWPADHAALFASLHFPATAGEN